MNRFVRLAVIGAVALRVVAAVVLVAGPWADEPSELAGWDVERFHQIAQEPGRPWVDHKVEYPPAAVAIIEVVDQKRIVDSHRVLVAASLIVDIGIGWLIGTVWGRKPRAVYFLVGVPLIPMGLLRLDLWSAGAAVGAVALWHQSRSSPRWFIGPLGFSVVTTVAAMIKVWPALLVAAVLTDPRRGRAYSAATVVAGGLAGAAWMIYGHMSLDPLIQVISLRGATGWHVESVAGSILGIIGHDEARLELNAYRIGTINPLVAGVGRILALGAIGVLTWLGRRAANVGSIRTTVIVGLTMAGSVSALLVTSPLLSPQFLLWLVPWVAIGADHRRIVALGAGAITTTGVTLLLFSPPNLDGRLASSMLLGRDLLLVLLWVACARILYCGARPNGSFGAGSEPQTMPC